MLTLYSDQIKVKDDETYVPIAGFQGPKGDTGATGPVGPAPDMSAYRTSAAQDTIDAGKQAKIAASGMLKGDGNGGVTAATAGTDYQAPLVAGTDYETPAGAKALGLTGASVGDIVKVAAVDANGKPTSWTHVPADTGIESIKGKVLWTGDFYGEGTLQINGLFDYRIVCYYQNENDAYPLIGTPTRGGGLYAEYGSNIAKILAYRFTYAGSNIIGINSYDRGIVDGTSSTYDNRGDIGENCHIMKVVGLVRA